ncbi:tetratricopeptide repeat protein [Salmonirosea aquatica]|uniref:Uncharacterized protein n=1 Tax=Salmonirosea aquatica TaxID=2654236 RepID=A0A7C9FZ36_9BACT|nr:hypothetical protein [Cytophagaceae bacterium SJW1-29]
MNERIEPYFNEALSPPEREQFEQELLHNPQLAEEVAFYLSTRQVLREQILAERHAAWQKQEYKVPYGATLMRRLQPWYYAAAAVVLLALTWFWLSMSKLTAREMAGAYIEKNLVTLSVQMGGEADSLQMAIQSYNDGQFATARSLSEALLQRNPDNAEALKLVGIIALRQQNYDEAITYFHRLAQRQDLYANPGTFYEALAYLQRNRPSDVDTARKLLQTVVSENLDGKPEAVKWLEAMDEK